MAISESATTNRTSSASEPRHVGSQHIGVGAPTGRMSSVGEQTCRLPSKLPLGSRQTGRLYLALGSRPVGSPANCRWGADRSAIWRWGADLSAPQPIAVGEPTGRFPRKLPLGDRHVGSPDTAAHVRCTGVMDAPANPYPNLTLTRHINKNFKLIFL